MLVLFPAPLGPITACKLRSATSIETLLTAAKFPNDLLTLLQLNKTPSASRNSVFCRILGTFCRIAGITRPVIAALPFRLRNGAKIRCPKPIRPVGENRIKPMNIKPKNNCQLDVYSDKISRNRTKNEPPNAGPRKWREPPRIVIARISPE